MSEMPTIEELFDSVLKEQQPTADTDSFSHDDPREKRPLNGPMMMRRMRFAHLYVRSGFDARVAYRRLRAGRRLKKPDSVWPYKWAHNRHVLMHLRQIFQQSFVQSKVIAGTLVNEMLSLNAAIIFGDMTDLLEQVRVTDDRGNERTVTSLRPISEMTRAERMLLHKIKFNDDGAVVGIEAYNRQDAIKLHAQIVGLLKDQGASTDDWNTEYKRRMDDARRRRIAIEVAAGKVIQLPSRGTGT